MASVLRRTTATNDSMVVLDVKEAQRLQDLENENSDSAYVGPFIKALLERFAMLADICEKGPRLHQNPKIKSLASVDLTHL
ncbi:MAG: hypothetical protein Q7Q73_10180 [Verrucomicrobiota bacterium JB024]|nr:hypothetical protein [Verrucomicrobiota bacterium JB024]